MCRVQRGLQQAAPRGVLILVIVVPILVPSQNADELGASLSVELTMLERRVRALEQPGDRRRGGVERGGGTQVVVSEEQSLGSFCHLADVIHPGAYLGTCE